MRTVHSSNNFRVLYFRVFMMTPMPFANGLDKSLTYHSRVYHRLLHKLFKYVTTQLDFHDLFQGLF